jgi:hypothetical protein
VVFELSVPEPPEPSLAELSSEPPPPEPPLPEELPSLEELLLLEELPSLDDESSLPLFDEPLFDELPPEPGS